MTFRRPAVLLSACLLAATVLSDAAPRPKRPASPCGPQGTQTLDQVFRYTQSFPEPRMHRELGTQGIQGLSGFKPSRFWQNPGLTLGAHELQTSFMITGQTRPGRGGVCIWLQSLDLTFRYTDLDVYVSNDYEESSCEGKVILEHELQHVAVHRRLYAKYRVILERKVRALGLPTARRPGSYASLEAAKRDIGKRIQTAAQGVYAQFKRELTMENGKLDTAANYKRTQARCNHWK